jgi:hypothetical protein
LADPGRAGAMAAKARAHVARHHGMEGMAQRYLGLLGGEDGAGHEKIQPWIPQAAEA